MSCGIVYIAFGTSYIEDAKKSAKSVRENNPDISITLFTDEKIDTNIFDDVRLMDRKVEDRGDSILKEKHLVYDKNLYLDADTYVCKDISDLFDILDVSDLAVAHNEARAWYNEDIYNRNDIEIPDAFPEYNTGVIAYKNTGEVETLFDHWNQKYEDIDSESPYEMNQPAFRVALHDHYDNVNVATLPPEYNFMTHTIGFASGDVKILHQGQSDEDLQKWGNLLNSVPGKKVTSWEKKPCRVIPHSYESRRYRIEDDILRWMGTARRIKKERGNLALTWAFLGFVFRGVINIFKYIINLFKRVIKSIASLVKI